MTLIDMTRTDADEYMRNRIEELIIDGQILTADDDVLLECARRYVATEHNKRDRRSSRTVETYHKITSARSAKLRTNVSVMVVKLAGDVLSGWAPELLAGTFAVGDGTVVSFADATIEQHEARASLLESYAAGTLETASIHRRAIADCIAAHQLTLRGVVDALIAC